MTIQTATTSDLMHALCERMRRSYTVVRPALRQELLALLEDDGMHTPTL